jgi:hypothetical protein
MRIHGNTLTLDQLNDAADAAGVTVTATRHGSRIRNGAWEVKLSGSGGVNLGYRRDNMRGATWDETGAFLARVFDADPTATVPRVYVDRDDFHAVTGARFVTGTMPSDTHKRHAWQDYSDAHGLYPTVGCTKCSAFVETWQATERRRADGGSVMSR